MTTRTRRLSPTITTSTTRPTSVSNAAPRISMCASEHRKASSRKHPGASTGSREPYLTDTPWELPANTAPACLIPCTPWGRYLRPPAPTRSTGVRPLLRNIWQLRCHFWAEPTPGRISGLGASLNGFRRQQHPPAARTQYVSLPYRRNLDGSSGKSAFGAVTNANSTSLYRQRQIQAGCRFIF